MFAYIRLNSLIFAFSEIRGPAGPPGHLGGGRLAAPTCPATIAALSTVATSAKKNASKAGQTTQTDAADQISGGILWKSFNMSDLQNNQLSRGSNPVKVDQTDLMSRLSKSKRLVFQSIRVDPGPSVVKAFPSGCLANDGHCHKPEM